MTQEHTHPENPRGTSGNELPLTEYLGILLDEWRTLAVPLFLSLLGAAGYLLTAVPQYDSSGVVQVASQDNSMSSAMFDITGMGKPSPVETEVEILRSRSIVADAARRIGLNLSQEMPKYVFDLNVSLFGRSPVSPDLAALRHIVRDVTVED
jgi:tyrosine-protein kinase Etk/Wzc